MRRILYPLLIILLGFTSNAQEMSVGPEVGLNILPLTTNEIGSDYGLGFHGGIKYQFTINEQFALSSGVYYSQLRHTYVGADTSLHSSIELLDGLIPEGIDLNTYTEIEGRTSLNYIQLPVTASYSWNGLGISLGGYVGYRVNGLRKERIVERTPFMQILDIESFDTTGFISMFLPPPFTENYETFSNMDNYQNWDYGLIGKLSYQMDPVVFTATYTFGLPDHRIDYEGDLEANRYYQFSVAYLVPLKKLVPKARIE